MRCPFQPNKAHDRQETGKCILWGLQNASLQAPRTTHRPKLPRNSRNYRELDSIQVLLPTVRKHENAFLGACKMHFCRGPKIHTAPKTNACTGARKMHFATLPERIVCADNAPNTHRCWECGCGPSFTWAVSAAVRCPGVPNPKDCREIRWSAQPGNARP